jgi:hypothetical protein
VGQRQQHVGGLVGGQNIQSERVYTVQCGQPVPAGDKHETLGRPREQGAKLIVAGGVI